MKLIKKIILILFLIFTIFIGILGFLGYRMYQEAILISPIAEKVSEIQKEENYTTLENVSIDFKNAVIAIEDHRFYQHHGFDIISIGRATLKNIQNREFAEGGSTITQQIAKNLYFSQKKEFSRKIAELFMAFSIEKQLSKEDILEIYININFYGNHCYGIYEASYQYYQVDPSHLTLNQSAMLAGIPNAPSVYAPTKNPELATQRKNQVLKAMLKYHYISQEQYDACINEN